MRGLKRAGALLLACAVVLWSCQKQEGSKDGEAPLVVVTTTMIASAAQEIGGDAVQVRAIMRAGGDPHLYQPRPSDAKLVNQSALVLTSGLHLEGWIDDLVRNAGGERRVLAVSQGVDAISMEGSPGGVDPHFWFDLQAWSIASQNITAALAALYPAGSPKAAAIMARGQAYQARMARMHTWAKQGVGSIPRAQRILITSHDAFHYFGRAYDIEVVGIQGVSTEQQASQRDVANVIELVRERQARAIFVESSVNPALIKQVARETGVKVSGPLYSDSVGLPESGAHTMALMFQKNMEAIVTGLGGSYEPFNEDAP